MIITIDGPSGTGKSTVAKELAKALGIEHFDTGALYRALCWHLLDQHVAPSDQAQLSLSLESFNYQVRTDRGQKRYIVGEVDVTEAIRHPDITAIVSEVSALREVREALMPLQLDFSKHHDAVFEGRDLGTVVFPHADLKFFLTAKAEVRAKRRLSELESQFPDRKPSFAKTLDEIKARDEYDEGRAIAPLKMADDGILIETSDLSIQEVVKKMKHYADAKRVP